MGEWNSEDYLWGHPSQSLSGGCSCLSSSDRSDWKVHSDRKQEILRHLEPHENTIISLNKWGQYASGVQLILRGMGLGHLSVSDPHQIMWHKFLKELYTGIV